MESKMNNKKTAEIWMEFDEAYRDKEAPAFRDRQELLEVLLWLERWAEEQSCRNPFFYHMSNVTPRLINRNETGKAAIESRKVQLFDVPGEGGGMIRLEITDGEKPIPGFMRIFPAQGSNLDQIPVIRMITGESGIAGCSIPAGRYRIEITGKGCCSWEKDICLEPGACLSLEAVLSSLDETHRGWIPGDLHHHSIFSSPVYGGTDAVTESPGQVSEAMRAAGCRFGALSDHHNVRNHKEWGLENRPGFCPLLSKEISTSNGHVAALGVSQNVIYHIPEGVNRTSKTLREEFLRTAKQISELGGIPVLNHPFDTSRSTSWPQEMNDILPVFGAMEVWNGAHPMLKTNGNGKALKLWLSLWQQGIQMTAVAGSDTHNIRGNQFDDDTRRICILLEAVKQFRESLPDAVRDKIAVLEEMEVRSLPRFLNWTGRKLGSGCAVTYVHAGSEITQKSILEAIRKGRCMITDGALLFVRTAPESSERLTVEVQLVMEKAEGELCLTFSDGSVVREKVFPEKLFPEKVFPENLSMENDFPEKISPVLRTGSHEYSLKIEHTPAESRGWVAATLETEREYLAVANPVFYEIK